MRGDDRRSAPRTAAGGSSWIRRAGLAILACLALGAGAGAASGAVYHVAPNGSDGAAGTASHPWRTLSRASAASLAPGDRLLLRRGDRWRGDLLLTRNGSPGRPIAVGAYGRGPAPVISSGRCVVVAGSHVTVTGLRIVGCRRSGVTISGDAVRIAGNVIASNIAGVEVDEASSGAVIASNRIVDNNRMAVLTPGGGGDNGAFGILLHGDRTTVAGNRISGSDAFSYDYGRDGSAVEIFGARDSVIRGNLAIDNLAFTELGDPRSVNTTYVANVVRSSLPKSVFLITRGGGNRYGPVAGTRVLNNTVRLTGAASEGFICQACSPAILFMRNNVIQAVKKVGYAAGRADEDYDLFSGGIRQFPVGSHSIVANPRFVAPARGDLRLRRGSPAVDRGIAVGVRVDFAGHRIPLDGNGDGRALPDLGAFERQP